MLSCVLEMLNRQHNVKVLSVLLRFFFRVAFIFTPSKIWLLLIFLPATTTELSSGMSDNDRKNEGVFKA